jgi:alpha-L-fucosidase 2
MFDAHPPFQIDGNFGCAAGIAEMLLQSHDGAIQILPALPDAWPNGSVKGLVARGGFVLDMTWSGGKIRAVEIHSRLGGNCRLRLFDPIRAERRINLREAEGVNPNSYYILPESKPPLVSPKANIPTTPIRQCYVYDIQTATGGTYRFTALSSHQ